MTQDFFLRLLEKGYIFKDTMESPYCPTDKRFLPDRYIKGTCPYCGFTDARGDQCDNCGRHARSRPIDRSTLPPLWQTPAPSRFGRRSTSSSICRNSSRSCLIGCRAPKTHWRPNTVNFALNWIKEGLRPRAITRDLDWGVPVPLPGYEDKRIYVWFDAVIGYFSASIEWAHNAGKPEAWKQVVGTWSDNVEPSRSYYFIGKDNIPFHTIIWPAMLLGYGGLTLPYDVPANEFMTMGGFKASSSRGNVIWTKDVLDQYGPDPLRYYLASTMPESHDTDFTYEELVRRNNDELVATYGNAVHRVLTFAATQLRGQGARAWIAERGRRGDAGRGAAWVRGRRRRPSRQCICAMA